MQSLIHFFLNQLLQAPNIKSVDYKQICDTKLPLRTLKSVTQKHKSNNKIFLYLSCKLCNMRFSKLTGCYYIFFSIIKNPEIIRGKNRTTAPLLPYPAQKKITMAAEKFVNARVHFNHQGHISQYVLTLHIYYTVFFNADLTRMIKVQYLEMYVLPLYSILPKTIQTVGLVVLKLVPFLVLFVTPWCYTVLHFSLK